MLGMKSLCFETQDRPDSQLQADVAPGAARLLSVPQKGGRVELGF